ncbi:hypothetical protein CW751_08090 [Brumimicrobium salinarum]|uniref:Uncharacterized protein n=1 Tax=Brumimicrobium salinarum TaxID=2058658 RepID=A0A2I0R2B5_9FLAO|nr:hypothetical protein [Brumimicrobium salinarum]PKR80721.1 hypothetical protein CW751_08090 [Brumimicrobium salinarum]
MEPIIKINSIRSNDDYTLRYRIKITQGAEQITCENSLLEEIKNSIPYKAGVIEVKRLRKDLWEIETNK